MYKYKSLQASQTTARAFVFFAKFIIAKYLEQEVDDDFCVDKRSPCGLSITGDKVMTLLPQWRSALWASIKELFLLPKLDNSSPCD